MTTGILRLPNLIVIGVTKAGTSALFEYLGRHPDVGLSDVKEVRYFLPVRYGEELAPWAEYAAHFTACHQRYAVEATPGYFYGGYELARVMRLMCAPKVILSLREPISRCWSWYRFEKSRMLLPKELTFDEYLDLCFALHNSGLDGTPDAKQYWGVGGGCYDLWMGEWIDVFGDELQVVFFEDLVADPEALMTRLFGWLGLDSRQAQMSDLEPVNTTQLYRLKAAQLVAVKINRRGERFFRQHAGLKRVLRAAYYRLNRAEPVETMSAAARERLEAFYAPHTKRLAEQLNQIGVTLPVWT